MIKLSHIPSIITAVLSVGFASFQAHAESVLWNAPCDDPVEAKAFEHVAIEAETEPTDIKEGSASLRLKLTRDPGMTDSGWGGWYIVQWAIPKIPSEPTNHLKLWYKVDQYEPYYPFLWIKLVDGNGRVQQYHWSPAQSGAENLHSVGRWVEVDLPLGESSPYFKNGDPGFGPAVYLQILHNYNSFKQFGEYIRWVDDLRIVGDDTPVSGSNPKPSVNQTEVNVENISPAFPVLFVPNILELSGKNLKEVLPKREPLLILDDARYLAHDMYKSWNGPNDFSINFWAGWNTEGLFLLSSVKDDIVKVEDHGSLDFKDSDNWRIYIDTERDAFRFKKNFDAHSFLFATIPSSSDGTPQVKQIIWPLHHNAVDSRFPEDRIFGEISDNGWKSGYAITPGIIPNFSFHENRIISFAGSWADTDDNARKTELFWPQVRISGGDGYYADFSIYGDMVLMSPYIGFSYRLTKSILAQGEPLEFNFAVKSDTKAKGESDVFELKINLTSKNTKEVVSWDCPIRVFGDPTWYKVTVPGSGLQEGEYTVFLSLQSGQIEIKEPLGWPITVNDRDANAWRSDLQKAIAELKTFSTEAETELNALRGQGYKTDYALAGIELIKLFVPEASKAVNGSRLAISEKFVSAMREARHDVELSIKQPDVFMSQWRAVPAHVRPGKEKVSWNDGAFRVNGKPFYYIGFCGDKWRSDALGRMGFNAAHTNNHFKTIMPDGPDQKVLPEKTVADVTARALDLEKAGMWVSPEGIQMGSPPTKWMQDDQDISKSGGHFIPYSLESVKMPQIIDDGYKLLFDLTNKIPNIGAYLLLNEPDYEGRTPAFADLFRKWLAERYATIGDLNTEWKSNFSDFDEIPNNKLIGSVAGRRDWATFNRQHFLQHVEFLHRLKNKYDTENRPDHLKLTRAPLSDTLAWSTGLDWEAIAGVTDIVGYDSPEKYEPIMTDFMWSMRPEKTLMNSELHVEWMTENAPWSTLWRTAAHGCDAMIFWWWRSPDNLTRDYGDPMTEPLSLYRVSKATLDIQRLADELYKISSPPRQVAILYTLDAITSDSEVFLKRLHEAYDALQWQGAAVRFVTEKQIDSGLLSSDQHLKVLVVPAVNHMDGSTLQKIVAFSKAGGSVVGIDKFFEKDTAGRPIKVTEKDLSFITKIDSRSHQWASNFERWKFFDDLLDKSSVHRPVKITDQSGRKVFGVETLANSDEGLVFIMPSAIEADEIGATVLWQNLPLSGKDLISNQDINGTVTLKKNEPLLIRVEKQK